MMMIRASVRRRDARYCALSPHPNSGLPEFGNYRWPKSGKPDFGWGEGRRGASPDRRSSSPSRRMRSAFGRQQLFHALFIFQ
jgi:hypothetical protein